MMFFNSEYLCFEINWINKNRKSKKQALSVQKKITHVCRMHIYIGTIYEHYIGTVHKFNAMVNVQMKVGNIQ